MKFFASILSKKDHVNLPMVAKTIAAHTSGIHVDMIDGYFAPNIGIGLEAIYKICKVQPEICLDIHIMATNPSFFITQLLNRRIYSISFHIETLVNHQELINMIRAHSIYAGIAVSPKTPISKLAGLDFDYILIMSVNPGFSGQKFIQSTFQRVAQCKAMFPNASIFVDGGIDLEIAKKLEDAGVDGVVMGHALNSLDTLQIVSEIVHSQRVRH